MKRIVIPALGSFLFLFIFAGAMFVSSCQKEPAAPPAQQAAPAAQSSSAPASQPAAGAAQPAAPAASSAAMSGKPAGPLATEKHQLRLTNYANTAITVSLNGVWVGQWDSHTSAPLDTVVVGKNTLTVELADEPKNAVTLEVNATRGGQEVNLLRLNFQGKAKGTYTYDFGAR